MEFDERLIAEIQADPLTRTVAMTEQVFREVEVFAQARGWTREQYDILVGASALIAELQDAEVLPTWVKAPEVHGERDQDCRALFDFIKEVETQAHGLASKSRFDMLRGRFRGALGHAFSYQFSAGDLDRVQHLVNELREHIGKSQKLEDEHRQRLLRRLERLQSELHKKMSDLDRFWGLVGEAGVVVRKLGEDAKPIVDRVRELAQIVWNTQARAEELPSGTPLPPLLGGRESDAQEE